MSVMGVFTKTDWAMLAIQKQALLETISISSTDYVESLTGILHFLDAIQDAAANLGFPVVWLDKENLPYGREL